MISNKTIILIIIRSFELLILFNFNKLTFVNYLQKSNRKKLKNITKLNKIEINYEYNVIRKIFMIKL